MPTADDRQTPEMQPLRISKSDLITAKTIPMWLRGLADNSSTRSLRTKLFAKRVPGVGNVSVYQMMGLFANRMLDDVIMHSVSIAICQGSRTFPVDPLIVQCPELATSSAALASQRRLRTRQCVNDNLIDKLTTGWTIALPFNRPFNVHWIPVIMWLQEGVVKVTHVNSCASFDSHADHAVVEAMNMIKLLERTEQYNKQKTRFRFQKVTMSNVPRQPAGSLACGEYTLSVFAMFSQNKHVSHTFSSEFVDSVRLFGWNYLNRYRVPRGQTLLIDVNVNDEPCMLPTSLRSSQLHNRKKRRKKLVMNKPNNKKLK